MEQEKLSERSLNLIGYLLSFIEAFVLAFITFIDLECKVIEYLFCSRSSVSLILIIVGIRSVIFGWISNCVRKFTNEGLSNLVLVNIVCTCICLVFEVLMNLYCWYYYCFLDYRVGLEVYHQFLRKDSLFCWAICIIPLLTMNIFNIVSVSVVTVCIRWITQWIVSSKESEESKSVAYYNQKMIHYRNKEICKTILLFVFSTGYAGVYVNFVNTPIHLNYPYSLIIKWLFISILTIGCYSCIYIVKKYDIEKTPVMPGDLFSELKFLAQKFYKGLTEITIDLNKVEDESYLSLYSRRVLVICIILNSYHVLFKGFCFENLLRSNFLENRDENYLYKTMYFLSLLSGVSSIIYFIIEEISKFYLSFAQSPEQKKKMSLNYLIILNYIGVNSFGLLIFLFYLGRLSGIALLSLNIFANVVFRATYGRALLQRIVGHRGYEIVVTSELYFDTLSILLPRVFHLFQITEYVSYFLGFCVYLLCMFCIMYLRKDKIEDLKEDLDENLL